MLFRAGGEGVGDGYQCEKYSELLHEITLHVNTLLQGKKIGMKSVTYWYQFFTHCEVSESVLHIVKFTKCFKFSV